MTETDVRRVVVASDLEHDMCEAWDRLTELTNLGHLRRPWLETGTTDAEEEQADQDVVALLLWPERADEVLYVIRDAVEHGASKGQADQAAKNVAAVTSRSKPITTSQFIARYNKKPQIKLTKFTISDALDSMLRHAWLGLCASDLVDPRRAPHPWIELEPTSRSSRIELGEAHASELLMICAIAQSYADRRDARAVEAFAAKVSHVFPGVQPMDVASWKAAHRNHALPPLESIGMYDRGWQDVRDVWLYVR